MPMILFLKLAFDLYLEVTSKDTTLLRQEY